MSDTTSHPAQPPPGYVRTADLMASLSLASDLAVGLPAEHAVRSCYIAMHVADQMQLPADQRVDVYYAELLMDAGCTAWTSQLAGVILNDEIAARRDMVFRRTRVTPPMCSIGCEVTLRLVHQCHAASAMVSSSRCRAASSYAKAFATRARWLSALLSGWACPRQSRTRCCQYSSSGTAADQAADAAKPSRSPRGLSLLPA